MSSYQIVPASAVHIESMLPFVRQADIEEVKASSGKDMRTALLDALRYSDHAWAGIIDGEVACIFGVGSLSILSDVGVPWLIGTDAINRHSRAFLRRNLWVVALMRERYPVLRNWVDARNTAAIRWLKWLGFTLGDPAPWGAAQLPFHPFEMRGNYV